MEKSFTFRVNFLGTNGWFDTKVANTICTFIETRQCYIVLDAGYGFHKLDKYIKGNKPVYLFLSHLHLDHIVGLHTLPKFCFPQGIDIFVPKGELRFIKAFINAPYTLSLHQLSTKIRLHELTAAGAGNTALLGFDLKYRRLRHQVICYGYRFYLENKIISYCTDTGICPAIKFLAKDADVFISECSYRPKEDVSRAFHLNPQAAADIAVVSGAKKLALTHFDAWRYPDLESRKEAELTAKRIFKNTFVAYDDMELEFYNG